MERPKSIRLNLSGIDLKTIVLVIGMLGSAVTFGVMPNCNDFVRGSDAQAESKRIDAVAVHQAEETTRQADALKANTEKQEKLMELAVEMLVLLKEQQTILKGHLDNHQRRR